MPDIKRKDLLYPQLSYKIVGVLFDVCDKLGSGHKEKYYENALKVAFNDNNINFKNQLHTPLMFNGKCVGKYFLDFLIEDKIVLELKIGNTFSKKHIEQVYSYLKVNNLKLGIIAMFSINGLKFKRIINII